MKNTLKHTTMAAASAWLGTLYRKGGAWKDALAKINVGGSWK